MNESVKSKRVWPRLRSWVFGLIILVSGMVIGSGATIAILVNIFNQTLQSTETFTERTASRMQRILDLTDEQRERFEMIFHTHLRNVQDIREQIRPDVEQELEQMNQEIVAILNQEQAQEWEVRFSRIQQFWDFTFMEGDIPLETGSQVKQIDETDNEFSD